MPNLGILVGQGIMAWKDNGLTLADKKQGRKLLNAISENFEVGNENLIDAVTAVSGSGPAYFFFLADALTSAARNLGLTAAQSRKLVEKTMSAAAKLQQGRDYGELIKMVRSKKGTTDAALRVFAKRSMEKIIREAVTAAYARARKLSR
jgi:pyrroline-5-carboxylate reductase